MAMVAQCGVEGQAGIVERMRLRSGRCAAQPREQFARPLPANVAAVRADVRRRESERPESRRRARLTRQERYVLSQREQGVTFAKLAGHAALRKPDGTAYSRQRVKQLEQSARAKLGAEGTVETTHLAAVREAQAELLRERGRGVRVADLRHDPREVAARAERKLSEREALQGRIEALASELLEEGLRGRLSAARAAYYRSASESLAAELAGHECG